MTPDPVQSGFDDATAGDKIEGIIDQMHADVSQGNVTDLEDAVRQRFVDAGLDLTPERLSHVLAALEDD